MNTNNTRRAAVPGCALVLTLGAVMLAPLSAQASNNPVGQLGSTLSSAVTTATGGSGSSATGSSTLGTVLAPVVTPVLATTDELNATTGSSANPNGLTTNVAGVLPVNLGSTATSGAITVPGVVSVGSGGTGGVLGSVGSTVGELLGGSGTGGSGSGSGGLTVSLGNGPEGGSVASVTAGSSGSGTASGTGTSTSTTTSTTTITNTTTNASGSASTDAGTTSTSTGTPTVAPVTTTTTPAPTASAAPAVVKVLSLAASPSVGTVYPVKDGYRDDVVFRVAARLSSSAKTAVSGSAVLTRGSKAITQWAISQPTQDLRWNGLDHGKLVAGTYVLTATMKDATGASHTTTTKVLASSKRLIATTQKVNALAVSGTKKMAAAPRAGLAKGNVTLKVTTVAPKVKGKQFLYFVKNGKRLTVPIKQGTHTSKAIIVPKAFTSFTLKHTWKKGQVKLKAIRYTYSYQSLR